MCDSQVLIADNGLWFAKNSDREPEEPQAVVRLPAVRGDSQRQLRATHITIPQVADRHAVILSKPCWIWGAEMGVNEHGLVIGNEAIFSRSRTLEPGLLGMDLLRLALERASDARGAITVITDLLLAHGQGGPAGFADKGFHYDSSFLIADPQGAWILETAGREWAARPVAKYAAISNALSLEDDYTLAASGVQGAFRARDSRLLPWLAASRRRRQLSLHCLAQSAGTTPDFTRFASHLRQHHHAADDPLRGSNADVCLHATGPIRRSQTTGSMIVWLGRHGSRIIATGTAAPCLSLFRPLDFAAAAHVLATSEDQAPLWQAWQAVHRSALFDANYRARLRAEISALERQTLPQWLRPDAHLAELDALSLAVSERILAWPRAPIRRSLLPLRQRWARATDQTIHSR